MKNICYLLATMFLNENGKTGHQNVYVSVKGKIYTVKGCQSYLSRLWFSKSSCFV